MATYGSRAPRPFAAKLNFPDLETIDRFRRVLMRQQDQRFVEILSSATNFDAAVTKLVMRALVVLDDPARPQQASSPRPDASRAVAAENVATPAQACAPGRPPGSPAHVDGAVLGLKSADGRTPE